MSDPFCAVRIDLEFPSSRVGCNHRGSRRQWGKYYTGFFFFCSPFSPYLHTRVHSRPKHTSRRVPSANTSVVSRLVPRRTHYPSFVPYRSEDGSRYDTVLRRIGRRDSETILLSRKLKIRNPSLLVHIKTVPHRHTSPHDVNHGRTHSKTGEICPDPSPYSLPLRDRHIFVIFSS